MFFFIMSTVFGECYIFRTPLLNKSGYRVNQPSENPHFRQKEKPTICAIRGILNVLSALAQFRSQKIQSKVRGNHSILIAATFPI